MSPVGQTIVCHHCGLPSITLSLFIILDLGAAERFDVLDGELEGEDEVNRVDFDEGIWRRALHVEDRHLLLEELSLVLVAG